MTINNINDLASYIGIETNDLEKALYKGTECGAWIRWDNNEVSIGSIVEGSDAEFSESFQFPFDSDEYDRWMDELELLVEEAWIEANGSWEDEEL